MRPEYRTSGGSLAAHLSPPISACGLSISSLLNRKDLRKWSLEGRQGRLQTLLSWFSYPAVLVRLLPYKPSRDAGLAISRQLPVMPEYRLFEIRLVVERFTKRHRCSVCWSREGFPYPNLFGLSPIWWNSTDKGSRFPSALRQ
jgi:hypothetical protein